MKFITILWVLIIGFTANGQDATEIATALSKAYQLEGHQDKYLMDKAITYYERALAADSVNVKANKGLGTLYYNEAIHLYNVYVIKLNDGYKYSDREYKENQAEVDKYYALAKPHTARYNRLIKLEKK